MTDDYTKILDHGYVRLTDGYTKILDHGYVRLIDTWGSDENVISSARMSTGSGFRGWGPRDDGSPGDEKLLKFLWDNQHSTPYEMAGLTVEVKAPIVVFREWFRHRTQSYSEVSARYVPLPNENYIPDADSLLVRAQAAASSKNRQASNASDHAATMTDVLEWLAELADGYDHMQRIYESGLRRGIPKEVSRLPVPVGRYSVMRASANLRNWLGFCKLRCAPGAQWEIRQYSNAVAALIEQRFPRTYEVARADVGMP